MACTLSRYIHRMSTVINCEALHRLRVVATPLLTPLSPLGHDLPIPDLCYLLIILLIFPAGIVFASDVLLLCRTPTSMRAAGVTINQPNLWYSRVPRPPDFAGKNGDNNQCKRKIGSLGELDLLLISLRPDEGCWGNERDEGIYGGV